MYNVVFYTLVYWINWHAFPILPKTAKTYYQLDNLFYKAKYYNKKLVFQRYLSTDNLRLFIGDH